MTSKRNAKVWVTDQIEGNNEHRVLEYCYRLNSFISLRSIEQFCQPNKDKELGKL